MIDPTFEALPEIEPQEHALVPVGYFGKQAVYSSNQLRRNGWFLLLYGAGGAGKTTCAASIADSKHAVPTLLVDIDRTSKVLAHRDDIKIIYIHTWEEFYFDFCVELSQPHPYKSIILDGMSDLADMNLKYNRKLIHSAHDMQHYAALTSDFLALAKFMRDYVQATGISVIMTAWEEREEDELTGIKKHSLAFNPKLQTKIQGHIPTIGYLEVNEDNSHTLFFGPSKRHITKFSVAPSDAANSIPRTITNPSLGVILDTMIDGTQFPIETQEKQEENSNG